MISYQERLNYKGDLSAILKDVVDEYDLSKYENYEVIEVGYEDFNVILNTSKDKYLVKIFANHRSNKDAKRYLDIMLAVLNAGISHPMIYQMSSEEYLYRKEFDGVEIRLVVMDYICGETIMESAEGLTVNEVKTLIKEAAKINKLDLKTPYLYDEWVVVNFKAEYDKKKARLKKEDKDLIRPLYKEFKKLNLKDLPHTFVHGDILSSNVMRDESGILYILDFSASNNYPRI